MKLTDTLKGASLRGLFLLSVQRFQNENGGKQVSGDVVTHKHGTQGGSLTQASMILDIWRMFVSCFDTKSKCFQVVKIVSSVCER